ncbi:hypothetical protein RBY4I_2007 [Rhodobacterales bacterium Y4I]|nr:hypothetical protein RBY4I_2007 [Rhodobacterales bacterium Y4I]
MGKDENTGPAPSSFQKYSLRSGSGKRAAMGVAPPAHARVTAF